MKYVYFLSGDKEAEQKQGVKDYLASRGIFPGDCTTLVPDYGYDEQRYDQGVRDYVSALEAGDVLYVWDFSILAKSLESLHTVLFLGVNKGVSFVQCMDGTVASNDSSESLAIVNAIGIASRIELKISKIQKRQKFSNIQNTNTSTSQKKTPIMRGTTYKPGQIVVRRYSEKAVLVCGNTRDYKDAIRRIGGLFNPKIDNGRAAWVVALRKLGQLQEELAGANYIIAQDCYIPRKDYAELV